MTHKLLGSIRSLAMTSAFSLLLIGATTTVPAQPISAEDSAFYLSINLEAMKQGQASGPMYDYLDREVLDELRDEFGLDLADSLRGVSIFGTGDDQVPVLVLHGNIPQSARDRIVDELFADKKEVELRTEHGRNYYAFGNLELDWDGVRTERGGNDALLLAFSEAGQTLITPHPGTMDRFLRQGSLPDAVMAPELVVLQADRALVHGGLNNRHRSIDGDGHGNRWQSEVFRKVERFALLVADEDDAIRVSIEAHSKTAELADALKNIVQGIVSLKALDDDGSEELAWLERVRVVSEDRITRLDVAIPPESLVSILD